jgi:hypothetical protein
LSGQCGIRALANPRFQGAGHTSGDVVCRLPDQRVLFGVCLLKSITSQDLD